MRFLLSFLGQIFVAGSVVLLILLTGFSSLVSFIPFIILWVVGWLLYDLYFILDKQKCPNCNHEFRYYKRNRKK